MLLCDGCGAGWHFACAGLDGVPEGQWACAACVAARVVLPSPDTPAVEPTRASTPAARRKAADAGDALLSGRFVVKDFAVQVKGRAKMLPFWGVVTYLGPAAGKECFGVVWEEAAYARGD